MVKKLLLGMCLSLGGLVVALGAVELAFRLFALRQGASTSARWSDRPPFYFKHESSATLKDYAYVGAKPAGTFRIAVVGDSYSFAPYMQFTDAFPKVLERMLNLNAAPLRGEVINFGVPGYSTSHEIEEVDKAIAMGTDVVLLQITLNDPELKPYRPTGIREFNRFGKYQTSGTFGEVLKHWHSLRFVLERLHNNHTQDEYKKYFFDLFENPRSRESFESSVRAIAQKTKAANVRLVAVVFPLFGLPLDDNYPFTPIHVQVAQLLANLNVPSLDLFDLYRGIPLERLQVIPGEDRHPNEIAHRMAAERIYGWLIELGLVPADLQIRGRFTGRTQIIKETPYTDPPSGAKP